MKLKNEYYRGVKIEFKKRPADKDVLAHFKLDNTNFNVSRFDKELAFIKCKGFIDEVL